MTKAEEHIEYIKEHSTISQAAYLKVAKTMNHKTLEDVKEATDGILELVNSQAEDGGLWFKAKTAPEAYLQQKLRRLHQIIEDKLSELEKLKL